MDKLVYISAVAAQSTMKRQEHIANNIANVSTPGFRSQLMAFQAAPIQSKEGLSTRAYAIESTVGFDDTEGPLQGTGRDLDLAIQGKGWFALQSASGKEVYTRNGAFGVTPDGLLVNSEGMPVVGVEGDINIPRGFKFGVSDTGIVSGYDPAAGSQVLTNLGQVKLVNPERNQVTRRDDGYFERKNGRQPFEADATVRIASGFLEGSNVNPATAMVEMITAQREFEAHLKMVSMAEENSKSSNSLLSLS